MNHQFSIRLISENDAGEVLEVYKPYVLNTIITFEYEVPAIDEFLQRIKANITDYPWLVCQHGNKIIGYAYAGLHRYRTAYQWSCESSVYLLPEFHRKGIASILYETLFSLLRIQGYINVYAGISLPNEKSVGFHQSYGFKKVGIYKKIGYKFDKWHDVEWFQLQLQKHIDNPPIPKAIQSIVNTDKFIQIFQDANESIRKIN
ncbi:MAG TPA: GNAT family N-acetyltransferase [Hanamia sp.]|nr:GNAT family N-acetyltransferase [Hanamia sp.]